jgi:hypothetical protein
MNRPRCEAIDCQPSLDSSSRDHFFIGLAPLLGLLVFELGLLFPQLKHHPRSP